MTQNSSNNSNQSSAFKIIIIAVSFGILIGITAELIFQIYYAPPLLSSGDVIIRRQSFIEWSKTVEKVINKNESSLVTIYKEKTKKEPYYFSDILGNGIVFTSDGWILTYLGDVESNLKDSLVVQVDNLNLYNTVSLIKDPSTNLIFLKIEAENLVPGQFGNSDELIQNEFAIILSAKNNSKISYIQSLNYSKSSNFNELNLSSEEYSKFILIQDQFDKRFSGSPVINLDGEIIGILKEIDMNGFQTVIPVNYFNDLVNIVLNENKIVRPYLGINYIDLSRIVGLDKEINYEYDKGALIYKSSDNIAVKKDSPAVKIFKEGDIILKIDNEELTENKDLSQIILEYQPGQKLDFLIFRDDKEENVEVELSQLMSE